jgi:flagellar protein FliS
MANKSARAYAATEAFTGVNASDPGQLIVLVYQRVFDHLNMGKKALEAGDYGIESFTKAHDLIQQGLLACLDYNTGGEVAQSLGAVYEWSLRELISARSAKSPERIQEIIDVLTPLYEAWLALAPNEFVPALNSAELNTDSYQRAVNY